MRKEKEKKQREENARAHNVVLFHKYFIVARFHGGRFTIYNLSIGRVEKENKSEFMHNI